MSDFPSAFESIQKRLSVSDSSHAVTPMVLVSQSVRDEWKGVELNANVSLSASFPFGCCYVWFNLSIASSLHLVAKHLYCSSAFDVLLANVAMQDELPGKP